MEVKLFDFCNEFVIKLKLATDAGAHWSIKFSVT